MEGRYILFALVGILQAVGGQMPEITSETPPVVAREGETARLVCSVTNKGGNKIVWVFEATKEQISSDAVLEEIHPPGHYNVEMQTEGGVTSSTLSILGIRGYDAGSYLCLVMVAGLPHSQWPKTSTVLTVESPPYIRYDESSFREVGNEGDTVELTCVGYGIPNPNITWSRVDGQPLPNGEAEFTGKVLSINNASFEHSGEFRCVADNGINPRASMVSELAVATAPRVTAVVNRVGQIQNRLCKATLGCIVEGYPSPEVEWSRVYIAGREKLESSEKFYLDRRVRSGRFRMTKTYLYTLTINSVNAVDYRDFTCTATNSRGSAQAVITVFDPEEQEDAILPPCRYQF